MSTTTPAGPAPATPEELAARVRAAPASVVTVFPAVPRLLGDRDRALVDGTRVAVLEALAGALDGAALAEEVQQLYRYGDADEKRAVLLALPRLPLGADVVRPLLGDALRTNDVRLVAAAVGPAGQEHLPQEEWRHAVVKCLFTGVPLAAVAGLGERDDDELVRMVTAYVDERVAAGRDVPADVWLVLPGRPETEGA